MTDDSKTQLPNEDKDKPQAAAAAVKPAEPKPPEVSDEPHIRTHAERGALVGTPTARHGWFSALAGEVHPATRVTTPDGRQHTAGNLPLNVRITYNLASEVAAADGELVEAVVD